MPADKKKPAKKAAASRSGSTARRTAAAKTTARKTVARKTTTERKATTARKTTTRKPAAKPRTTRPAAEPVQPEVPSFETDELDQTAGASGVGPFVVGSSAQTSDAGAQDAAAVAVADATRPGATIAGDEASPLPERYPEDIPIMIVSAILAASTFLPWYRLKTLVPPAPTATGFATGTWGPMILLLGLASLAIAVLRRAKVRVGLPIADSHFHEFVGWIAIVGAVIKLRALPQDASGAMERSWGVFVAIGAAFILAFLAGRMSGSAPFTTIPGWFRGRAGKLGVAMLVVVAGASAALGVTLNQGPADLKPGSANPGNVLQGKFPACSRGFPRVDDAKPLQGFEGAGSAGCVFTYTSEKTSDQILTFYKSELTKAGYRYEELTSRGDAAGIALRLTAPTCGQMAIQPAAQGGKGVTVIIAFGGPCPSTSP